MATLTAITFNTLPQQINTYVIAGNQFQLIPVYVFSDGGTNESYPATTYSSSNTAYATVDAKGFVSTLQGSVGYTSRLSITITASASGVTGTYVFQIEP